jgi:hypothetical protein
MKHFILLLSALALLMACGTTRRVSASEGTAAWEGRTTSEIMRAMGDPDRIDPDGKGGSILVYESAPDYDSPDYDILDPEASAARTRKYARFYLDDEGVCYKVDTNRSLPAPPRIPYSEPRSSFWIDLFFYLPLIAVTILI